MPFLQMSPKKHGMKSRYQDRKGVFQVEVADNELEKTRYEEEARKTRNELPKA